MKKSNLDKLKEKEKKKEVKSMKKKKSLAKEATKKRRRFRFWYWLLIVIIFFALIGLIGAIGFGYYIVKNAPEYNPTQMFEKESSRVFDSEGNLFATLGAEQRQKIVYDEIPEVLIDAIIATEDSRFFQHKGFDFPRFLKASIGQILGRNAGGASTLTMQLSKLVFTDTVDEGIKGIIRKFTDIYMSVFKLEKNLTKEEIIEYYVNTPCMGGNIYGVKQAASYYFDKDVKDLNLVEAALIAGLFQSPNGYNPYYNPNDGNARKNTVLYLMKRHGYITESEYEAGTKVEIKTLLGKGSTSSNPYQGFIDTVVQEIIDETKTNPYDTPMDIYTTMVRSKQDIINNFYDTYKFKDEKVEVGIGAINVKTGAIIAVGAGRNKEGRVMGLNVATFSGQIKRHPGSTIKPIMDYGPAFEYTKLSTYGPFIDDETPYAGGNMKNANGQYAGFMSTKKCLSASINTCALQAFRLTTNEQKMEFITKLGIYPEQGTEVLPQSYSIGAFNGVSPVQLAGAYAAFASGGYYTKPYSFTKLVYTESEKVYEKNLLREKVMSPQTAYMVTSILVGATKAKVKVYGTQIATKTGTTSYDKKITSSYGLGSSVIPDSWTSSYTKDYAIAIWYGYPAGLTKEYVANKWYLTTGHANEERFNIQAAIANKFYEKNASFTSPGGLVSIPIELETIPPQRPSEFTPSNLTDKFLFISGTEPSTGDVSARFSRLPNVMNASYKLENKTLKLKWTAPATPSAIDTNYLTDYFNNGYSIWANKYLNNRLNWNKLYIGDFGFSIYLTSGDTSTYVGWTGNSSYDIDLNNYTGVYDGVIIKSTYSIYKNNGSSGIKLLFKTNDDVIDEAKISVNMNNTNVTYNVGGAFAELSPSSINRIEYDSVDITPSATDISVITSSITKKSDPTWTGAPKDITTTPGTYTVKYSVSFTYSSVRITKIITQTVTVN